MNLRIINGVTSAPGVRAPKVPALWGAGAAVISAADWQVVYRNDPRWDVPGRPILGSLEIPTAPGGVDIRDDKAFGLALDVRDARPGRPMWFYSTRGPRGFAATADDAETVANRARSFRLCLSGIDLDLYSLLATMGGGLAPELYPFRLVGAPPPTPAQIRFYAMRRTAWTVPVAPAAPTVCWRGLPPFMQPKGYGAPWSLPEWQAHVDGMIDGGAVGFCLWDWLTSEGDVVAFEKWINAVYLRSSVAGATA